MGILDGIVEWIAEQVMAGLDLVTTSVLGALGCDMAVFLRYFPAAETMYSVFVALAIGIILLNWVWQLFKNFGLGAGVEAEDPVKLSIRSVIFILLTLFSDEIVNIVLTIGGTPYHWIMESDLPALSFADFNSVMLVIIGVCQWGCGADYLDFGSHPGLELPKTSVRGSRTVCAARCTGLHGSCGFFYGRQPDHSKHLEILVPDAWRSNFPIGHERLVPAPVHKHGGVLPCEPAFVVRRSYP
ncbi:hypothetical protein [Dysosmobacter welbionis]